MGVNDEISFRKEGWEKNSVGSLFSCLNSLDMTLFIGILVPLYLGGHLS